VSSLPTTRLARDERRDQLIRMGVELLGHRPYDQISITDLAQAAGISKGLLYHYFATKSDFVVAVLRQSRGELEQRLIFDPSLEPAARLDAGLDAFLTFVEEHAAGFKAVARARYGEDEAIVAELAEGRRRRVAMLVGLAAAFADADYDAVASPALEAVIAAWLAFSEELVVRWIDERALTRDDVRHLLRQAFLVNVASVAGVDRSAAAARLAQAAERAAAGGGDA
jgi:AcrR family transcriptional regulator